MKILVDQADHYLCHYTLVLDSYSKFCDIGCVYCYAKDFQMSDSFYLDISRVERIFDAAFNGSSSDSSSIDLDIILALRKKIPIRLGFETDPFQKIEQKVGVTKRLLEIFNKYHYPHIIFTKSDLILSSDYEELLNPQLTNVQVSISSFDNEISRRNEPRAPLPEKRGEILSELNRRGVEAIARVNILPRSLRSSHALADDKLYYESLCQNIKLLNCKKVIINEIQDRQGGDTPGIDLSLWSELKTKIESEKKTASFCYLGGASSRYYQFANKSCSNCCQCELSRNDTQNGYGLKEIFKSNQFPRSINMAFNYILLKAMTKLLKWSL